jgi:hypothetical protein
MLGSVVISVSNIIFLTLGIEKDKKCRVILNFRNGMKRNFC